MYVRPAHTAVSAGRTATRAALPGRMVYRAVSERASVGTEMACALADIVIRRTELGAAGHPGADVVGACARIAAEELGWDDGRRDREIAAVDAFYVI